MAATKFLGKDLRYRDQAWLQEKYIDEQMSAVDIGKLVQAGHNTVSEWLKIHGIQKRDHIERYSTARSRNKRLGEANPHWRGGVVLNGDGRIYIFSPRHPHAWKRGYVSRAKLTIEKQRGEYLPKDAVIHHINRIPTDDRIENLMILSRSEHAKLHARERAKAILDGKIRANNGQSKINSNIA